MKRISLIALLAILSTASAYADRGVGNGAGHGGGWSHGSSGSHGSGGMRSGGWGHHGGGWGWGGDWIFPALIGGAIAYDLTTPEIVYVEPAPADADVPSYQQGYAPPVAPSPVQSWYFCPAANGYYPYVRTCPSGWQVVPAIPPR